MSDERPHAVSLISILSLLVAWCQTRLSEGESGYPKTKGGRMGEPYSFSRRGFLKVGAVAGCAAMTMGVLGGCAEQDAVPEAPAKQPEDAPKEDEAVEQSAAPMIYLIDRMVVKPGKGREVHDAYLERFEAVATEKGMTLEHAIVAPPIWLTDPQSNNTLEFIWSFEGYGKLAAAISYGDSSVTEWWRGIEESIESRDRSYFSTEVDVEVLNQ